jgi:hypothetical protein
MTKDVADTHRSYFVSSKFSDLTIRTDTAQYQVHRVIVCGQSEYFARLFNGNWTVSCSWERHQEPTQLTHQHQETADNVVHLKGDEPQVVEAMIRFIYGSKYNDIVDVEGVSRALFSVMLYQAADKYAVPALQTRVRKKFESAAESCWEHDDFPDVIAAAFAAPPQTDRSLRDILVRISQAHIKELVKDDRFLDVLHTTADFAADLVQSFVRSGLLIC